MATSRRITLRRNVSLVACGVLAIVAIATTALHGRPRALPGDPNPAPTPTVLPDHSEPHMSDLRQFEGATVTIPSWGTGSNGCRSGPILYTNGLRYVQGGEHDVYPLNYLVSDVDGDGVQDYVVHLICGGDAVTYGQQIVAFHKTGTQFTPIGRVIGSPDGIQMMSDMEARDSGKIAVWVSEQLSDGGQALVPSQWRVYQWQAGRFRQVEGPTSFAAHTPSIKISMRASDLVLRNAPGDTYRGDMMVIVRNDGDAAANTLDMTIGAPLGVDPFGAGWAGCTRELHAEVQVFHCPVKDLAPGGEAFVYLSFVAGKFHGLGRQSIGIRQLRPSVYDTSTEIGTEYQVLAG